MPPGDPLAEGEPFGLLSLGATSAPGETSVNMKISNNTISQYGELANRKGWNGTSLE